VCPIELTAWHHVPSSLAAAGSLSRCVLSWPWSWSVLPSRETRRPPFDRSSPTQRPLQGSIGSSQSICPADRRDTEFPIPGQSGSGLTGHHGQSQARGKRRKEIIEDVSRECSELSLSPASRVSAAVTPRTPGPAAVHLAWSTWLAEGRMSMYQQQINGLGEVTLSTAKKSMFACARQLRKAFYGVPMGSKCNESNERRTSASRSIC
jgi:hypothetical protein